MSRLALSHSIISMTSKDESFSFVALVYTSTSWGGDLKLCCERPVRSGPYLKVNEIVTVCLGKTIQRIVGTTSVLSVVSFLWVVSHYKNETSLSIRLLSQSFVFPLFLNLQFFVPNKSH